MLGPRVNRDFSRLLSLNKSATILRHRRRARDARGRLKATIGGDYRLVYALLNKFYEATATGASEAIRKVVKTVATLRASSSRPVTLSALAKRLERSVTTVSAHVQRAMAGGWLVNEGDEWRYALKLGEPMPSHSGLPSPEDLARRFKALRSNQGGSKTPPLPPASPTRNGGGR